MTVPPPPRGRKTRLVRPEDPPGDLLLVIRATPTNRTDAVAKMALDAQLSAELYVLELSDGRRELLYGVSVFAHREGVELQEVLDRFRASPMFVEAPVGVIRAAGFEVIPTGTSTDHFDVQLIAGMTEADSPPADLKVRTAAARLLDAAGEMLPNPFYTG